MKDLGELHAGLARVVLVGRDLGDVLADITKVAKQAMPAVDAASITLIRQGKGFTAAYEGRMALDADEMQYQRGYGPCLDAGLAGQVFMVQDMATDDRWPDYSRHASASGIRSSMSLPLPFQTRTIGALNSYSARSNAFSPEDRSRGEEVASWIALAVGTADAVAATARELDDLHVAMRTRAVIEQAKGILMERYTIGEDQAFKVLTRSSQVQTVKLRKVAEELVTTGVLGGVGR